MLVAIVCACELEYRTQSDYHFHYHLEKQEVILVGPHVNQLASRTKVSTQLSIIIS